MESTSVKTIIEGQEGRHWRKDDFMKSLHESNTELVYLQRDT